MYLLPPSNLSDKRVMKRIRKAVAFAGRCLSPCQSQEWAAKEIDKYLGQRNTHLSRWLRQELLVCIDHNYMMGVFCKHYLRNEGGYRRLMTLFHQPGAPETEIKELVLKLHSEGHEEELQSGCFEYKVSSCGRYFSHLQNVPRKDRAQFWQEWKYEHTGDIEVCAPTLLYQHALNLGMKKRAPGIEDLLQNKKDFRHHIAVICFGEEYTEKNLKDAKSFITSLFNGAQVKCDYRCSIYRTIECDDRIIRVLRQDPRLKALRDGIRQCWLVLGTSVPRRRNKKGHLIKLSGTEKSRLYYQLETKVIDTIHRYLDEQENPHLTIHDGWRTRFEFDPAQIKDRVKEQLGFDINIEVKNECV